MTSSDNGVTWTARTSANDTNGWRSITYGNGVFVAVPYKGSLYIAMTSTDCGVTWTGLRLSAVAAAKETNDWEWLYVAYGGGVFVAVANNVGTNRVMTSFDNGVTWVR